jgi:hypothetical protein
MYTKMPSYLSGENANKAMKTRGYAEFEDIER